MSSKSSSPLSTDAQQRGSCKDRIRRSKEFYRILGMEYFEFSPLGPTPTLFPSSAK